MISTCYNASIHISSLLRMDQFFIRREGELIAITSPSSLNNILSFPHASPEISSWSLITQYKDAVVFRQSGSESQPPHQQSTTFGSEVAVSCALFPSSTTSPIIQLIKSSNSIQLQLSITSTIQFNFNFK
jgi:hypothetical protein